MEPFPAITISNAIAIVLVLLPISWHWRAKNIGTLLYIGWTVLGNLNWLINTIVWRGTWEELAPRWCDFSSKIIIGQSVGLTAASLCINRKLYNIATIQSVTRSPKSKRINDIVDLCLGILLPIIVMALHYVVQPNRYNIIENIGCWPPSQPTLLTVPMTTIWPIIIGTASFIYCGLSIRAFLSARQQFNQVLNNSGSGVNMSRYFRLMALATEEMLFTLPFAIFLLVTNLTRFPVVPWVSWEDTHLDYYKVIKTPWILLRADPMSYNTMMINLWVLPAGGFLFFIWFGLGGEAIASYKNAFWKVAGLFGIKPKPKTVPASRWQSQLASNTSSAPSRAHAQLQSLPDLEENEPKRSSEEDLEAAKAHAV
ncbi:unnamed protein product [Rhizoctonia solani]|nr:unnamed protein product [Rhizoctonia solani]